MYDFSGPLAKGLVLFKTDGFHNIAPRRNVPSTVSMTGSLMAVSKGHKGHAFADAANDHFILDNGGNPILGNLANCTFLSWVDGATASNRGINGSPVYSERVSGTPIWKFVSHGEGGVGTTLYGIVHRSNAGSLTQVGSNTSIEGRGLSLIGFTKESKALAWYLDGIADGTSTLNGDDTLTLSNPVFGWDTVDTTANSRCRHSVFTVMGWNRVLKPNELREVFRQGPDIFKAESGIYLPVAAAAGGVSIPVFMHHYRQMHT